MSRKPATHRPPMNGHRPLGVNLFAHPSGGFTIRDPMWRHEYGDGRGSSTFDSTEAAFSTLEEALEWLRVNMDRPVIGPKPTVGR